MLANVNEELNRFAKYVISQSKGNLTRLKKGGGSLYDSLKSNLKVSSNSFELSFLMEEHGVFQDKGVSGVKKKYNTKYAYTTKMPPPAKLDKWIVRKGIAPRDKNGKFISRKSLQFMIARSIFNNGIKPSLFFTKPFEAAFKNIDKDLIKAFKLDVETLMSNSINNK
jgi:hypothetical protein